MVETFRASSSGNGPSETTQATKLPADVSSKAYDDEMAMFFSNGHFDPKDVAALEHALIDSGQLDSMPDTSKYLTEAFLP